MFVLFLALTSAYDSRYSLLQPFEKTNLTEIGHWTIRGTTTVLHDAIRLTTATPANLGEICQRLPFLYNDWAISIKATAHDGEGGQSFWVIFSEEVCPDLLTEMNGFALFVNLTSEELVYLDVHGRVPDPRTFPVVKKVEIKGKPWAFDIRRRGSIIDLYGTEHQVNLSSKLYMSLVGVTTRVTSNIDVLSVLVFPFQSDSEKDEGFSDKNRRFIEQNKRTRRKLKAKRRQKMQATMKTMEEVNATKGKLNGDGVIFDRAAEIAAEAIFRARDTITENELGQYISTVIAKTVQSIMSKVQFSADSLSETKDDLNALWADLTIRLMSLSIESKNEMEHLVDEVVKLAKDVHLENVDPNGIPNEGPALESPTVSIVLMIISLVEFSAYIIFFCYKRRRTHGFKKTD